MRNVLLRNTLRTLFLMPLLAVGHTTNMTTITIALAEDGTFEMVVQLDPGEKILGYQRYFELTRMEEAARVQALAPISQLLEKELRVAFDGGRVLLQTVGWTLPNAPYETFIDPTMPTMSQVRIRGAAPPRAQQLDFTYTSALALPTPVLFRVDKVGERLPFSRVVDGPDAPMRAITLIKPPPPLLNEREIVAAAQVIHGGRAFLQAYRRGLGIGWETALLPIVLCISVALASGAGMAWRRQHAIAGLGVLVVVAALRGQALDLAAYERVLEMALATLAMVAGLMAATRMRKPAASGTLGLLAAAVWAAKESGTLTSVASPVLSTRVLGVLYGAACSAAWLAFGLVTMAVLYQLRHSRVFTQRVAPVLGGAFSVAGGYWLVQAM
jgi:hypothetical protein